MFMGEANLIDHESRGLRPNKNPGYDSISSNVVKWFSNMFFTPLEYIFSFLLQQGIFPENWKIAKVLPIYKKIEDFLQKNQRPISILPCNSKLLERKMCNRFFKYFTIWFLDISQHWEHALLLHVDQLYQSLDIDKFTAGLFIDLCNAFDKVHHKVLTDDRVIWD